MNIGNENPAGIHEHQKRLFYASEKCLNHFFKHFWILKFRKEWKIPAGVEWELSRRAGNGNPGGFLGNGNKKYPSVMNPCFIIEWNIPTCYRIWKTINWPVKSQGYVTG